MILYGGVEVMPLKVFRATECQIKKEGKGKYNRMDGNSLNPFLLSFSR